MDCGQARGAGRINAVTGSAELEEVIDAGQKSAHNNHLQSRVGLTGRG